jgi:hypothetical protein
MSTTDNSPLLVASPQAEPTAELDDAMGREQRCFNCGVIKAITIVIDLLVARRALDQAQFLRLLDAHIAVLQQTADPPGVNPWRILPLQMLRRMQELYAPVNLEDPQSA